MNYSFNLKGDNFVKALSYEVNASYKDLGAVCDAIKYQRADVALDVLDKVISLKMPIVFRRHNKHMGARHEIGGVRGSYPVKAAKEVKKTLTNAIANAGNKGFSGNDLFIVSASANKTHIERRYPSKGSIAWGRGMYGRSAMNHSDIEFAKIEVVLSDEIAQNLTRSMKYFIKQNKKNIKKVEQKKTETKPAAKAGATPAVTAPKQKTSAPVPIQQHQHDHDHSHEHQHDHKAEPAKPAAPAPSKDKKPEAKTEAKPEPATT